jgi:hypothetical protein
MSPREDLIFRLRKRAEIRREIRKEGDRIAALLDEAADEIDLLDNMLLEQGSR